MFLVHKELCFVICIFSVHFVQKRLGLLLFSSSQRYIQVNIGFVVWKLSSFHVANRKHFGEVDFRRCFYNIHRIHTYLSEYLKKLSTFMRKDIHGMTCFFQWFKFECIQGSCVDEGYFNEILCYIIQILLFTLDFLFHFEEQLCIFDAHPQMSFQTYHTLSPYLKCKVI